MKKIISFLQYFFNEKEFILPFNAVSLVPPGEVLKQTLISFHVVNKSREFSFLIL